MIAHCSVRTSGHLVNQTELRPRIAEEINTEMVNCDLPTFVHHYLSFNPSEDKVKRARSCLGEFIDRSGTGSTLTHPQLAQNRKTSFSPARRTVRMLSDRIGSVEKTRIASAGADSSTRSIRTHRFPPTLLVATTYLTDSSPIKRQLAKGWWV